MSELPMRGHFRYLRFKTFSTTLRTPWCEVFCPLLSSSKHSGVPKDSQPPTFPSVGLHPHTWPKWGCDIFGAKPSSTSCETLPRAGRYGRTWFPITSCASGSTNCSPSFISQFSTFHDVSVSRCDGYCVKQRNSRCLPHIHLQPELARNNREAQA